MKNHTGNDFFLKPSYDEGTKVIHFLFSEEEEEEQGTKSLPKVSPHP